MNHQPDFTTSPFDAIRQTDEQGNEYWSARALYKLLGYSRWEKFQHAIEQGKKACEQSDQSVTDHFHPEVKMIRVGKGAQRKMEDYRLSRYGCYLVLQNADPTDKPVVALAQTYFAMQTRRQEIADQIAALPEDQLRLLRRSQMSVHNVQLAGAAREAGVIFPRDFAIFQDHGYKGLYGGRGTRQIHEHKELQPGQEILDHMGSDELAANIFRASQTRQKLEREQIQGKNEANQAHHQIGHIVRKAIKEAGGTMPEDLPTPKKSIQQLQREAQAHFAQSQQPTLLPLMDEQD